jgi:hypothetical protein
MLTFSGSTNRPENQTKHADLKLQPGLPQPLLSLPTTQVQNKGEDYTIINNYVKNRI